MQPSQALGYYTPQAPRPSVPARTEDEGNVILCMVDDMRYPITDEALETVVHAYGDVVQRVIYERSGVWQAVVQYATPASANSAKQALEGHAIYEGGYNKLRVFSSSKHALAYATAAIAMPEYKLSEQEASNVRAIVNGDDYFRAHSDIGRGAFASMIGQVLPPSFIPTSIAHVGMQPSMTVPFAGPHVYVRSDPYMNGPPPPGPYGAVPMTSNYLRQMSPANFQQVQEMRFPRPIPMTTYQQHPRAHPMQTQQLTSRNSQGQGMMSGGSERPKHV